VGRLSKKAMTEGSKGGIRAERQFVFYSRPWKFGRYASKPGVIMET